MDNKIFSRVEKKFLITKTDKRKLLKVIKNHMNKDSYHKSKVINLYFDTDNYDLIIQSIDRPDFKEKIRARCYDGYDKVFLEIKTKVRCKDDANVGNKRRVVLSRDDFHSLINGDETLTNLIVRSSSDTRDLQIAKEIDYLISYFNLKPKIIVLYDRESYKSPDNLRITFDENLKYRNHNLYTSPKKNNKSYFNDKKNVIMEVKGHGSFPLWLTELMSKNHIYSQNFSKIGNVYLKLRKDQSV